MHTLELFIDPICFCKDKAKSLVKETLQGFPGILFKEINVFKEPQRAQQLGVKMSPTLALNGKIISVGLPEENQLKQILMENVK